MKTDFYKTNSEDETVDLGYSFAPKIKPGDSIAFIGELGSGKTEMIKGICEYFEVKDIVSSPTFTLINQYNGLINDTEIQIFHIDLYRIKDKKELDEIGFTECFYSDDVVKLVEWAERADNTYNWNYIIEFQTDAANENGRTILINENNENITN